MCWPPGLDFVPGTLAVDSGANMGSKTDAAGDDQAEYDTVRRTVTFRLGTGADASAGGNITTTDAATTVGFDIAINPACGITVDNRGVVSCRGLHSVASHPQPTRYPSGDGTNPNTPVTVVVDTCAGPGDCPVTAPACETHAHPFNVCTMRPRRRLPPLGRPSATCKPARAWPACKTTTVPTTNFVGSRHVYRAPRAARRRPHGHLHTGYLRVSDRGV